MLVPFYLISPDWVFTKFLVFFEFDSVEILIQTIIQIVASLKADLFLGSIGSLCTEEPRGVLLPLRAERVDLVADGPLPGLSVHLGARLAGARDRPGLRRGPVLHLHDGLDSRLRRW